MPVPIIRSIDSLKNLPLFPDNSSVSELPTLRHHNLIYGFNASGKTTLSRVFACLGTRNLHEDWDEESSFSVTLTDGTKIRPDTPDEGLKERILVFITDFIAEKFRWKECEADPVFYIGDELKDLSEQIDQKENRIGIIDGEIQHSATRKKESEEAFAEYKTGRARFIEAELGLSRGYNAPRLEADYNQYTYSDSDLLDDQGIGAQKQILKQDAPLPELSRISEQPLKINDLIREITKCLQTTIGTISIDALRDHDEMLPWVKHGLDYHKTHDLRSCLLCGNSLTDQRIKMLEETIDERYDNLVKHIAGLMQMAESFHDTLKALNAGLPSEKDIVTDQQNNYLISVEELRSSLDNLMQQVSEVIRLLTKKQNSPNSLIALDDIPELSRVNKSMMGYEEKANAFNKVIDTHNTAHDDFGSKQNDSKETIKKHYLAEEYEKFKNLKSRALEASEEYFKLASSKSQLNTEIDNLKQQMQEHRPAADRINKMIHKYLGHTELEIAVKDEGYEILRNGNVATGAPSEGEKTAIAFSYFLVLLESDGRRRKDLIVVVDDPISSLDTRSLNYVCCLLESLKNVGQLFILTHNAHVMNELKKPLKKQTERWMERLKRSKDEATATLLFIDTVQPGDSDSRRSSIVKLPKYLREYESEYHYLFNMMLRFIGSEKDRENYFYVMPNGLRKILEVFLSFKRPGSAGLKGKIDQLVKDADNIGVDEMRIRALFQLVQVESHGDNIDDLITASSMTIEETKDAAETLLELIKKMDQEHKDSMCDQCRPEE